MPDDGTLREFLKRSFQVDLPIRGGDGNRATPIVVETPVLQAAVDVMAAVLRCVGVARRVGWRLLDFEVVSSADQLVRAGIETVRFEDGKVVSQLEGFYFVLAALPSDSTAIDLPAARGFVDPRSGVHLPMQLGWMHLHAMTDNEPLQHGLGWTVAYAGLSIEGTCYIYDHGDPVSSDTLADARVAGEFNDVVTTALQAAPGASVKHQAVFRGPTGEQRCLMAILDLPGSELTAALLTVSRGCFVKARITFDATEAIIARMAHESIEAFVDAARPPAARAS